MIHNLPVIAKMAAVAKAKGNMFQLTQVYVWKLETTTKGALFTVQENHNEIINVVRNLRYVGPVFSCRIFGKITAVEYPANDRCRISGIFLVSTHLIDLGSGL